MIIFIHTDKQKQTLIKIFKYPLFVPFFDEYKNPTFGGQKLKSFMIETIKCDKMLSFVNISLQARFQ